MLAVAGHHAGQGLAGAPLRIRREVLRVGQLRPDEQSHAVGGGVVARVGDLDVEAQAVEAHGPGLAELRFEEGLGGGRAEGLRVVILVERGAQVQRPAVEPEPSLAGLDGAEAEGLADAIGGGAVEGDAQGVEVRRVEIPQQRRGDGQRGGEGGALQRGADLAVGRENLVAQAGCRGQLAVEAHGDADFRGPRRDLHVLDVGGGTAFGPDGLPEAGEHPVPGLFAVGDFGEELQRVADAQREAVHAGPGGGGDVQLEGQVAALVRADGDVVEPDFSAVVHRAEVQDHRAVCRQP